MHIWFRQMVKWTLLAAGAFVAGCAGLPELDKVNEVYFCAGGQCGPASQGRTADEALNAVYQLLKHNDGEDFKYCSTTPAERSCAGDGPFCHFVMGGPIPGMGCGTGGRFKAVGLDTAGRRVTTTFTEYSTWNAVPNVCQDIDSAVTVTSADEVTVKHGNYYCNWMGVGNMASTFVMAIDYIDLDKGRMGGYWAHAVVGTGGGRGTGYAIMQFPQAMKKDENWLRTVLLDKKVR